VPSYEVPKRLVGQREEGFVRASNLIRWGGLAAFLAAALYISADLAALFLFIVG
jgi:hypothetical protein